MSFNISRDGLAATVGIEENQTGVQTFLATDPALTGLITYSLGDGFDGAKFSIDPGTGALVFKAAPDFEAPTDIGSDNTYQVLVKASNNAVTDSVLVTVNVANVNETPIIASDGAGATAALAVDETVSTITQVTATDPDANTALTYSIASGADAALFAIDVNGLLTFKSVPDVDAPADAGRDNVYNVVVKVSDAGGLSDEQALAITVQRVVTGSNENDTRLVGTAGADHIFGLVGKDVLTGLGGDDVLDGGADGDKMTGGLGDDTYVVDTVLDKVIELQDEGADTVLTSVLKYTLGANVENVTFSTAGKHSGAGNSLNNVLTGNAGKDTLTGRDGNDTLAGLGSDDTLSGGNGNDRLDGGAGADKMLGGAGDDTFVVDNAGDLASEGKGKGNDTVETSITWKLDANIEKLVLTGSTVINGSGNQLDNVLTGNAAANMLYGDAGNDTLNGAGGSDTLIGGIGADHFLFASAPDAATNVDTVSDFTKNEGDTIDLSKAVFTGLVGAPGTTLSAAAFYASATATGAHDADDRIIYNSTTGKLYYDADGLGNTAAVQIAVIGASSHALLSYADFHLVV